MINEALILDRLEAWYKDKKPKLEEKGYTVEFTRPDQEVDKKGAYLDIISGLYIARITLWNTGECVLEALDYETGNIVFWENHIFQDPEVMISTFDSFSERFFQ